MSGQFGKFDFSLSNRFANTLGNSHHGGGFSSGGSAGAAPVPVLPPTAIGTGLKAWFRADSGVTLNTTKVASYADKSGAGITPTFGQDDTSLQPTWTSSGINSLPDIVFGGGTFLSGSSALYGTTGVTIFGIMKTTSIGTMFLWGMQYNQYHYALFMNSDGAHQGQLSFFPSDNLNVVPTPSTYHDGLPHCFVGTFDSNTGACALYVDNGVTPVTSIIGSPTLIGNGVQDKNAMGSSVGAVGNDRVFNGNIPEVGAYDNPLSAPDVASLMSYLRSRAGI